MANSQSKMFVLRGGVTISMLSDAVERYLKFERGMVTQSGQAEGGYFVQAKEESDGWKKFAGMDMAITTQFIEAGENVTVMIGNSKWSDKVGAGVLGMFVFWPLAISAGVGAYKQQKLPEEIFAVVEKTIITGGHGVVITSGGRAVGVNEVLCPKCKTMNPSSAKFCSSCAAPLVQDCPHCGAQMSLTSQFCSVCGKSLAQPAAIASPSVCAKCGASMPENAKFCNECGAKVESAPVCPKCGAKLPVGAKFCHECGHAMQ